MMLLLLLFTLGLASAQQCHVPGVCTTFFTSFSQEDSYNACLQTCKEAEDCEWFTYYDDTGYCQLYPVCGSIDEGCFVCHTGQKGCQPETSVCEIHGFCDGSVSNSGTAESARDCLLLCQQYDDCNWYTYFTESKSCFLTDACTIFDESCTDCISGERSCFKAYDKLFVVGGLYAANFKAEIIDLSSEEEDKTCPSVPDYPASGAAYGSVGTFIGGQALVCGGYPYTSSCHHYEPSTNSWVVSNPMLEARAHAAAVQLSPTEWWVTGGIDGSTQLQSTEIYSVITETFSPFVDLPQQMMNHNLVQIDASRFMLVGDNPGSNAAWIFDKESEEWFQIADLQDARQESFAGLVEYPDGTRAVMVAGGYPSFTVTNSTEVFDLVGQRWQAGPDLSVGIYAGASVQFGGSFLFVGGVVGNPVDFIYRFDPAVDDYWVQLPQRLSVPSHYLAAFLVSSDFVTCS